MLARALRHPRTPWYANVTLAYALSPIDLIPDFIPVLGHLDDLVLVPRTTVRGGLALEVAQPLLEVPSTGPRTMVRGE